jgi:iron complex outermembrane recepter protein
MNTHLNPENSVFSNPISLIARSTWILLMVLFTSLSVSAQTPGSIEGIIKDSLGNGVEHALISLDGIKKTNTGSEGKFLLQGITPGNYLLAVEAIGYTRIEKPVEVKSDETTNFSASLKTDVKELKEINLNGKRTMNEEPVAAGKVAIKPMDLPQSVTVIDKTVLEQQQVQQIGDILKNVNGLYVMGTTGGTQEELAGRGFAYGSNNTFKNGIRFNNGISPEVSSLEKVEVLKGSAAILYGNVAPGGVLNLVTKKPKFQHGGEISFRAGSFGLYKPALDIYGPVNKSKTIAYRFNTSYQQANSFRDVVSSERIYFNPSVMIKAGHKTDILIEGDYLKDNRTPDYGTGAINYQILNLPRNRFLGTAWSYNKVDQTSLTVTINRHLGKIWNLQIIGGHQTYKSNLFANTRPSTIDATGKWGRNIQRTQSNESYNVVQANLTGEFKTGFLGHNLLAGAEYDHYFTKTPAFDIFTNPSGTKPDIAYDTINVFNPETFENRSDIPKTNIKGYAKNTTPRIGVYVQDLLTLSKKFKLLAGVRYSYQDIVSISTDNKIAVRSDAAFTPRIGLVYQPTTTTSIFTSYANSFTPNSGIDVNGKNLAPSMIDQYELGIKNDLFKGLLSANFTLYQIVNSNLSQTVLQTSPNYNKAYPAAQELAGEVTSKGAELDIMTKPVYGVSLIAGYSFNDTRYTKSTVYIVKSKLRYNPRHTANASLSYYVSEKSKLKGLNFGVTALYFGDRYAGRSTRLTVKNDTYKLIKLDAFTQLDITAGYTIQKFSFKVKVSNVLNEMSYFAHDDNSINPIAPRNFSGTVAYRFSLKKKGLKQAAF